MVGIWKTMPAPLGQSVQRRSVVIKVRERLQPRDIRRETKLAIANRQRGQGIGIGYDDIVARNQRMTINLQTLLRINLRPDKNQPNAQTDGNDKQTGLENYHSQNMP